jgi:hypothetical protein
MYVVRDGAARCRQGVPFGLSNVLLRPSRHPSIPRGSRPYLNSTFVISAGGAISPRDAQGLLAAVSRCSGGSLPSPLYPLSSWSASRLIPYVRQAVTFSVRRHLAACIRDAYSSAEAAP